MKSDGAYIPNIFTKDKMKFTTDSYIEIGNSHNICEDYALSGNINGEFPYIIVCDGCSSSKMTDLGARVMAFACQKALIERYKNMDRLIDIFKGDMELIHGHVTAEVYLSIQKTAMIMIEQLGLPYSVCDATLLYAFIYKGKIYSKGYGDGNVIIKMCEKGVDNVVLWENLRYESNAPFYISYDMDLLRKEGYANNETFGSKKFIIDKYFSDSVTNGKAFDSKEYSFNYRWTLDEAITVDRIQSITLASDGMESYAHAHKRLCTEPAPSEEEIQSLKPFNIMQRMVAYKNYNGEFVKRRMKRLKQEVEKIQGEHFDDVSCATIWIDHE